MKLYGIVGAGGFGREVIAFAEMMLKSFNDFNYQLVFVDEDLDCPKVVNHYPVMTVEEFFACPIEKKFFNIAIANYSNRKLLAELMLKKGAAPFRINAPNSIELHANSIAEGAIFCPFTTVTSNALSLIHI